ncbi:Swt1 family HEPN domain-containing protein [Paraburkholderia bannensis]|uniref:Swt1 family HEPN domain-containing protein n=1 Tax=Paraburkholderia bannensis TaxID=765414 RepID=UPI002ABE5D13|nr:Swt1 family HEPN domain-containing protein [Paraburkholderia bannensis]
MTIDSQAALFLMLGQTAERTVGKLDDVAPSDSLLVSATFDLAPVLPALVRKAFEAAEVYKLFYVFENYLREFVLEVLTKDATVSWWDRIPSDVQTEITKLEETEEAKSWMALGSRDKSALMTFPQLLRVIEHGWKEHFEVVVRDRALVQEARLVGHLRNTICHMSPVPKEEEDRVKQTMRDWFRVVAP